MYSHHHSHASGSSQHSPLASPPVSNYGTLILFKLLRPPTLMGVLEPWTQAINALHGKPWAAYVDFADRDVFQHTVFRAVIHRLGRLQDRQANGDLTVQPDLFDFDIMAAIEWSCEDTSPELVEFERESLRAQVQMVRARGYRDVLICQLKRKGT
jgi:hypothetical protein